MQPRELFTEITREKYTKNNLNMHNPAKMIIKYLFIEDYNVTEFI